MTAVTLLQKWALLQAAFADGDLSPRAKTIFGVLLDYRNARNGRCDPGLEELADRTGCRRRVVSDAIGELVTGGWITVQRRPGKPNYTLNFDRASAGEDARDSAPLDEDEDARKSAQLDARDSAHLNASGAAEDVRDFVPKMCGFSHEDVRDSAHAIEKPGKKPGKRNREESISAIRDGELFADQDEQPTTPKPISTRNRRPQQAGDGTIAEAFAEFWQAYPRRVARGHAERAFAAAVKAGTDPAVIIAGAHRYAVERAGQDPKYTRHPRTWLNGDGWLDEPDSAAPRRTGVASAIDGLRSFLEDRR